MKKIEEFTCLMYGYSRATSINETWYWRIKEVVVDDITLTTKSKVDVARLPPR